MNTANGTVRVWVPDVWEVVEMPAAPELTVAQLKADALRRTIGVSSRANPADYIVKYRGAQISDGATLATLGVPDKAPLIVLPARRRPVV